MKITFGPISFDILLLFRLCLPTTLLIVVCTAILLPFNLILHILDDTAPGFIGWAWLMLLICYIILGLTCTYFVARCLRLSFGSEERRVLRRMALVSGLPFYALCLLFLITLLGATFFYPDAPDICVSTGFFSLVGFVGFVLVSGSYLLLLRFFSGRFAASA